VIAIAADGAAEAVALDPARGTASDEAAVPLPHPPDGATLGPRGLVVTYVDGAGRVVHRAAAPDVRLPAPRSFSELREEIIATGPPRIPRSTEPCEGS
jgi:hypothetical protein